MQSVYLKTLLLQNPDIGKRYQMKLKSVNDVDPLTLNIEELDSSIHGIPPVTNMDIISYLVLTHSYYTKQQMKAYKSLHSYKYFESGFVLRVGTKVVNGFYILVGKVKHSQKGNEKPLDVWCIVAKDGSVLTAHCTCMAGHSEVCSHVGAILFATEYANTRKAEVSCTDVLSSWPIPSSSSQVPLVPISEMEWGKPSAVQQKNKDVPKPINIQHLLKKMEKLGHNAAIMRIVEPFASGIAAQVNKILPSVLNIFDESHTTKTYLELLQISKKINVSLDDEQIMNIEKYTRNQSENRNWYIQRAGRITASKFRAVCKTNKVTPSLSLVKTICYPTKTVFHNKAIEWGINHEHIAVEEYQRDMSENHDSFVVNEVGFLISKKWPCLGASPDRLVFCECCLGGCLEVKCPYLLYTNNCKDINEYVSSKNSCLIRENDRVTLKKSHSYYYQVQLQMFVTKLRYCDFIIWSPNVFFKERILPDSEFLENEIQIALKFHAEIIMPELLGKYFTRKEGMAVVNYWCICHSVDDGRPMIQCDGEDCEIGWFHFECVGLVDTPNNVWFCQKCTTP